MKTTKLLILTIVISLNTVFAQENIENDSSFTVVGGKYFGQNPPGMTAEIFAPGIVSVNGRYEYAVSFSPDLDEMYFSGNKKDEVQIVYFSKLKDNKWSNPKTAVSESVTCGSLGTSPVTVAVLVKPAVTLVSVQL